MGLRFARRVRGGKLFTLFCFHDCLITAFQPKAQTLSSAGTADTPPIYSHLKFCNMETVILFFEGTPVLAYEKAANTLGYKAGDIIPDQEALDELVVQNAYELSFWVLKGMRLPKVEE